MALGEEKTPTTQHDSAFAAFRYPDFRWMWTGQWISYAESQMQLITINWHLSVLTNSPVALGIISLARLIPLVIFSLFGGVYADAHDRRKILLTTQSMM